MITSATLPRAPATTSSPAEKWPVLVRLLIIVGLSALLWAGIISASVALFGGV